MAFWNRSRTKETEPENAKSLVVTDDLRNTINEFGGWPLGGHYSLIYRRQPAVRTVVDFLARGIGQLRGKTYLRLDNSDREEINDHPLAVLLRNPNPNTTRYAFFRDTVADIAIFDRAYWRKDRIPFPRAVVRVPPSRIFRLIEDGVRVYRDIAGNIIPREELVVFSGYSPEGAYWNEDGVSPLETLRRVLMEADGEQRNREDVRRNAARLSGTISRPETAPEWSDAARQRFRDDLENTMSGDGNGGRTLILEDGMTHSPASFSLVDAAYIEATKLHFDTTCRQYGVSPALFTSDGVAKAIDSYHRQLYQDTFGPWLRMLQDEIELQLLPDVETSPLTLSRIYFEFNLSEKLQGSFTEQATAITTAVGVPYMSVNEGRALLNLPRVDGPEFDMPIQPLNVMYGGQPAVPVPTAVPQPKQLPRGKTKSAPQGAIRRRDAAVKTHQELFSRYFRAQEQAFEKSMKKAAPFDMERWNSKLAGELYAARVTLATKTGKLAAKQIGGVYDEAITLNFLQETARRQAEGINANTAAELEAADDPASVFEVAKTSRSEQLGVSTAGFLINFARHEAAAQSQRADGVTRQKTWIVTSPNSRHPEMDGESVGIDGSFSNGASWPGDASAGIDDAAGCQCLMDIS